VRFFFNHRRFDMSFHISSQRQISLSVQRNLTWLVSRRMTHFYPHPAADCIKASDDIYFSSRLCTFDAFLCRQQDLIGATFSMWWFRLVRHVTTRMAAKLGWRKQRSNMHVPSWPRNVTLIYKRTILHSNYAEN